MNFIPHLKAEDGSTVTRREEMHSVILEYFNKIFGVKDGDGSNVDGEREDVVSDEQNRGLMTDFTFEEFTVAVNQMHPDKASSPDGLNPAFFQNFWPCLKKEVFKSCKEWLISSTLPLGQNETNIVLIPKKDNVECMKDLRPIALCNVLYKILAKCLG